MTKARAIAGTVLLVLACTFHAAGQQADRPTNYRLSLPDRNWALDISLSVFAAAGGKADSLNASLSKLSLVWFPTPLEVFNADSQEYLRCVFQKNFDKKSPSAHGNLTILFKPAQITGGAADFRDFRLKDLAKRATVKGSSLKASEYNQIPVARYATLRAHDSGNIYSGPLPIVDPGPRIMEAYFVKDDCWLTITLEASPLEATDEKLFYSLLDSVKIVDTSAPSTSFDYYHKGRVLFLNKEFAKAADALAAALGLEQQRRQLDLTSWRDLVEKLTDAYGATDNRARAKEVLQYGIENDPINSTFHMALARLYASLGDMDDTLTSLGKAFFYMKKEFPNATLPDPKNDPAFARYMKIDKFRDAVKAMRK